MKEIVNEELKRKVRNLGLISLAVGVASYSYSCLNNSEEKNIYRQWVIIDECDTRGRLAEVCEKPFPFDRVDGYYLDIQSGEDLYTAIVSRLPSENSRFDASLLELSSRIKVGQEINFLYSYSHDDVIRWEKFDSDKLGVLYTNEIVLLE